VDQRLGILYASYAGHNGIEMGQEQVYRLILAPVIGRPCHGVLEEIPQVQRFAKLSEKDESAPMGKGVGIEGKSEFSEATGHLPQSYHTGRFVEIALYIREKQKS